MDRYYAILQIIFFREISGIVEILFVHPQSKAGFFQTAVQRRNHEQKNSETPVSALILSQFPA